ncbi:PIN domain-containing protein [Deltaproteobacteria bacterium TL4]
MDNCCLNRPFDDQTNFRIHLEAEAIKIILNLCEQIQWKRVISEVNLFEIANTLDMSKRKELELLITISNQCIEINDEIQNKAKEFESYGLKAFDALHLACANTEVDVLLTVDDKFLKKSKNIPGTFQK